MLELAMRHSTECRSKASEISDMLPVIYLIHIVNGSSGVLGSDMTSSSATAISSEVAARSKRLASCDSSTAFQSGASSFFSDVATKLDGSTAADETYMKRLYETFTGDLWCSVKSAEEMYDPVLSAFENRKLWLLETCNLLRSNKRYKRHRLTEKASYADMRVIQTRTALSEVLPLYHDLVSRIALEAEVRFPYSEMMTFPQESPQRAFADARIGMTHMKQAMRAARERKDAPNSSLEELIAFIDVVGHTIIKTSVYVKSLGRLMMFLTEREPASRPPIRDELEPLDSIEEGALDGMFEGVAFADDLDQWLNALTA